MAPKVPAGSREATKLGGLEVEGFIGFFEFVGVDKVWGETEVIVVK
jgi:hypothetical protein